MNSSFNEYEKRFILTEVIKASSVPLDILASVIKDQRIEPKWDELPLPYGRTMKGCAAVFQELMTKPIASSPHKSAIQSPSNSLKRRHASPEPRALQPRPAANGSSGHSVQSSSQVPRKRGRPSNAEIAARAAEAEARGDPLPLPKTPGRKSIGDAAQTLPASGPKPGSGTGRGRGRPRKNESTLSEVKKANSEPAQLVVEVVGANPEDNEALGVATNDANDAIDQFNKEIVQEMRAAMGSMM